MKVSNMIYQRIVGIFPKLNKDMVVALADELGGKITEDVMKEMHNHINEILAPIGLCLYRLTPTKGADDYGLADKDGDSIDIELILKPAMDNYYKVDEG